MKKTVYEWLMAVGHRAGCHQRADRSFYWKGRKFPLCARCTGVLVGYILAVPAYTVCRKNVSVYAVCCIPLVIDGLTQLWEWQVSTNRRRCNRRFSGIWYLLYGDNVAVIRKKFNAKELVKDVLSKLRYGN